LARSATLCHLEGLESDRCRARLFQLCRLLSQFFLDLVPSRFRDLERWEIGRDGMAGQVTCLCQQCTVCHSLLPSYAPTFYDSPSRNESFARLHACSSHQAPRRCNGPRLVSSVASPRRKPRSQDVSIKDNFGPGCLDLDTLRTLFAIHDCYSSKLTMPARLHVSK
jgi:hypothetical protein